VHVAIVTEPSEATVLVDGEPLCTTPCNAEVSRSDRVARVSITRDGFQPVEREVTLDDDIEWTVAMEELVRERRRSRSRSRREPAAETSEATQEAREEAEAPPSDDAEEPDDAAPQPVTPVNW